MRLSPRIRRLTVIAAVAGFLVVPATGHASSHVATVGEVAQSTNEACDGANNNAVQAASAAGRPSFRVPFSGVLTRWSHSSRGIGGSLLKLKVFRLISGTTYLSVGQSGFAKMDEVGVVTNNTRIPVRTGDVLGFGLASNAATSPPSCFEPNGSAGDSYRNRSSDVTPGNSGSFPNGPFQVRANVSARLERDADGDGLGDDTQDGCVCPASGPGGGGLIGGGNALDQVKPRGRVAGKKTQDLSTARSLVLYIRPNEDGRVTGGASINVPKLPRIFPFRGAQFAKVLRFRRVRKNVKANVRAKVRLRLSKKRLRAVRRALRRGRRMKAKVRLTLTDNAGNKTRIRRTIKVKRRKRRR